MRGVSLLELVISVAVFSVVASIAFGLFGSAARETAYIARQAEADHHHQLAVRRLQEQLRFAEPAGIQLDGEAVERRLRFTRTQIEPSDGSVSTSGVYTLRFAYLADEAANGLDDNQNGLADEGLLILQLPSGEQLPLARNVLPASYRIVRDDERTLVVRFQTCLRYNPKAPAFSQAHEDGVARAQTGYVLTLCQETIRLRN